MEAQGSFDELAKQYEPMIYKVMQTLHIYKNKDEFFQTGLIALWEAYARFNPELGSFSAIAYPYIRGRMLMDMRKTNDYSDHVTTLEEEDWNRLADPTSMSFLLEEDLRECAKTLTPNQRKWLLYTVVYDLSVQEIARLEGVSWSAVKLWRKGAREKLKGYRALLVNA